MMRPMRLLFSHQLLIVRDHVDGPFHFESTALNHKERAGNDEVGIQPSGEGTFFESMQAEKRLRQECSDAFARLPSDGQSVENTLEIQRGHAKKIAQLDRSIGRLRKSVLIANLFSGAMALAILSLGAYFYLHPMPGLAFTDARRLESRSDTGQEGSSRPAMTSDLVFESDSSFAIRTDTDRKYQLMIRQLYGDLRAIQTPNGPIEVRNAQAEDYIRYMTDVSLVIQQAAQDQPSPEIVQALMNLALVGPHMRKVDRISGLNVEMKEKLDQIRAVLLARDRRSWDPEAQPAPYVQ